LVVLGENRKPDRVTGLNDFVASLEDVQNVSAFCGSNLQEIIIKGFPKNRGPVTEGRFLLRYTDR
jgi:hypothetical protein